MGLSQLSHAPHLLAHANHHASMARTANNAGEHCAWSIISSKTSLQNNLSVKHSTGNACIVTDGIPLLARCQVPLRSSAISALP
jgi:hypothetical protein